MPTSPDPAPNPPAPAGVSLGGLRLLAGAVAHRPVEIRPEPLADRRPYLAGGTIVVDVELAAPVREQVVVQAAMLAAGSFEPRIIRSLVGRSRATERYCLLEGVRAVLAGRAAVPGSVLGRVECLEQVPRTAGPDESRRLADRAMRDSKLPPTPEFFGQIRPLQVLLARDRAGTPVAGDLGRVQERADPDPEDEGEESSLLRALSNPLFGENAIGRMFRTLFGNSSSPSDDPAADGSGPASARAASTLPMARRRGGAAQSGTPTAPRTSGHGAASYPEWDAGAGRYRPDWVTVHEVEPWNPDGYRDAGPLGLEPTPGLRRGLATATLVHRALGRAAEGEQLHPDGVVDLALWRRLPDGPPPPPFAGSRRARPDVAVLVLLDASDSTQDDTDGLTSVFDQHLALSYRLTSALEGLGVPTGLYAFQAWGRRLVRVLRVKPFGERLGHRGRTRLGHLEPVGYTRMGAAVRHATAVLEHSAPGVKRVLVLVSDGFPYDEGYAGGYASADTRQAMWEARQVGIGCVCIGVTAPTSDGINSSSDALAAASAVLVGSVGEIEQQLGGLVRRAARDARRRSDHQGAGAAR
jgi:nitric oxide reductase NorD protein